MAVTVAPIVGDVAAPGVDGVPRDEGAAEAEDDAASEGDPDFDESVTGREGLSAGADAEDGTVDESGTDAEGDTAGCGGSVACVGAEGAGPEDAGAVMDGVLEGGGGGGVSLEVVVALPVAGVASATVAPAGTASAATKQEVPSKREALRRVDAAMIVSWA